ncbi:MULTISPECIES: trypsin-like serine protease [unclassified Streptomyces]|uniref:trypsin-like serine protease n=1 Tax=unclassified Streptomyces TaxID=2593676 RepID=UPI0002E280EA|nr:MULTISPECIES: trypsin-like serine protease [unclassified Streptomyces]
MQRVLSVRLTALAAVLTAGTLLSGAVPAAAVSGPVAPSTEKALAATVRVDIGDGARACSGTLVDARWVLTAASCFVTDPASGAAPAAGAPKEPTKVTVGRPDLTKTTGFVTDVIELAPYAGHDLVMARLKRPVTDIAPISLATAAPTAGETLRSVGYGRTATEWSPLTAHSGAFRLDTVEDGQVGVSGQDGATLCAGDAGGPLTREKDGSLQLVAVNSQSYQGGCFGQDATETRTDGLAVRVDDSATRAWVQETKDRLREVSFAADVTGDGRSDLLIMDEKGTITVRPAKPTWASTPGSLVYRFTTPAQWSAGWQNFRGEEGKGRLYFADVNGDKKADLIVHETNGDSRSASTRAPTGTTALDGAAGWQNFLGHKGKGKLYFADINGDKKADLIVHETNGDIAVRLNQGTYWDGGTHWSSGWQNFLGQPKGSLQFSDVTADGLADMWVWSPDGRIALRSNSGHNFLITEGDDYI